MPSLRLTYRHILVWFAAWKVRPSGPDRGLQRAAAYVPANTNTNVGTQALTHWRGISLSAPHVGFDCETLEQRNVKGVPPAGTHKRGNLLSVLYLTRYPAGGPLSRSDPHGPEQLCGQGGEMSMKGSGESALGSKLVLPPKAIEE